MIRHVRPKLNCKAVTESYKSRLRTVRLSEDSLDQVCSHMSSWRSIADHLPLYRQVGDLRDEGLELDRSTLADWVGGVSRTMEPLVDAIRRYVLGATKLHGDDIPSRCWLQETAKRKPAVCGPMFAMIDPRAARKRQRFGLRTRRIANRNIPANHLARFRGTLQADGFAGFNRLYEKGEIVEAACWAHVRRKFHDLYEAHASPIAKEALERIAALYGIEKEIRGRPPDERKQVREYKIRPLLESLYTWFKARWPGFPENRM